MKVSNDTHNSSSETLFISWFSTSNYTVYTSFSETLDATCASILGSFLGTEKAVIPSVSNLLIDAFDITISQASKENISSFDPVPSSKRVTQLESYNSPHDHTNFPAKK